MPRSAGTAHFHASSLVEWAVKTGLEASWSSSSASPATSTSTSAVESPQLDVAELQVAHDLQLVDAAQVLHAVSEVKQVRAVDGHLELVRLTQDENLKEEGLGGGQEKEVNPKRSSGTPPPQTET